MKSLMLSLFLTVCLLLVSFNLSSASASRTIDDGMGTVELNTDADNVNAIQYDVLVSFCAS